MNTFKSEKFYDIFELKITYFILRHKKITWFIQFLLIILNILGCVYCITGKLTLFNNNNLEGFKNEMVIFMNCLNDFLLVILNLLIILGFSKSAFISELIRFTNKKRLNARKESQTVSRCLHILYIAPTVPVWANAYFVGFRIGWNIYRYYLPRDVWNYLLNLMVCIIVWITHMIQWQFRDMNEYLEELNKKYSTARIADTYTKIQIINSLVDLSNHYNNLCNLLDRFNQVIKWVLVMLVMCVIVNILCNCTLLIQFGTTPKYQNEEQMSTYFLILQLLMALTTVVGKKTSEMFTL